MAATIDRPSPLPPDTLARETSARENRSKAWDWKSAGMPGPRSVTVSSTVSRWSVTRHAHRRPWRRVSDRVGHKVSGYLPQTTLVPSDDRRHIGKVD